MNAGAALFTPGGLVLRARQTAWQPIRRSRQGPAVGHTPIGRRHFMLTNRQAVAKKDVNSSVERLLRLTGS